MSKKEYESLYLIGPLYKGKGHPVDEERKTIIEEDSRSALKEAFKHAEYLSHEYSGGLEGVTNVLLISLYEKDKGPVNILDTLRELCTSEEMFEKIKENSFPDGKYLLVKSTFVDKLLALGVTS